MCKTANGTCQFLHLQVVPPLCRPCCLSKSSCSDRGSFLARALGSHGVMLERMRCCVIFSNPLTPPLTMTGRLTQTSPPYDEGKRGER